MFLTALAIVDDLGAVLVIALFYTENLKTDALLYSFLFWGGMILMNRLGVRNALIYFIVSLGMWFSCSSQACMRRWRACWAHSRSLCARESTRSCSLPACANT